jgi:hypothetical protein
MCREASARTKRAERLLGVRLGLRLRGRRAGAALTAAGTACACHDPLPPSVIGGERNGRTAGACITSQHMGHGGRDARWIRCDASGHCLWTARTSVVAARLRIYEATRGPVPGGARLDNTCGNARCVNLDHQKIVPAKSEAASSRGVRTCRRGHEVSSSSVVRHRDGRIALPTLSQRAAARAVQQRCALRTSRKRATATP